MKYTQKDVCRLLNITRETLRTYEKLGILKPEIDPKNQYRYYDDYQVYLIAECKRYQANEFSLNEIQTMLEEDSLADYTARMENRLTHFEKKALEYEMAADLTRDYVMRLNMVKDLIGKPFEGIHEAVIFVPEKRGHLLHLDEASIEANHFIMNHLKFTFMMAYFPSVSSDEYEWGFGMPESMCSQLNLNTVLYRKIQAFKAVSCIVDAGSAWHFEPSLAKPLLAYAAEHGLSPSGPFCLRQLVKTKETDGIHRYFEAFLPIE